MVTLIVIAMTTLSLNVSSAADLVQIESLRVGHAVCTELDKNKGEHCVQYATVYEDTTVRKFSLQCPLLDPSTGSSEDHTYSFRVAQNGGQDVGDENFGFVVLNSDKSLTWTRVEVDERYINLGEKTVAGRFVFHAHGAPDTASRRREDFASLATRIDRQTLGIEWKRKIVAFIPTQMRQLIASGTATVTNELESYKAFAEVDELRAQCKAVPYQAPPLGPLGF